MDNRCFEQNLSPFQKLFVRKVKHRMDILECFWAKEVDFKMCQGYCFLCKVKFAKLEFEFVKLLRSLGKNSFSCVSHHWNWVGTTVFSKLYQGLLWAINHRCDKLFRHYSTQCIPTSALRGFIRHHTVSHLYSIPLSVQTYNGSKA